MGPKYPGFPGTPVEGASSLEENPDADPFPERVVTRGRAKRQGVTLFRPGTHFDFRRKRLETISTTPFEWPFSGGPGGPAE